MLGSRNNNISLKSIVKGLSAMTLVVAAIFLVPILLVTSFINMDIGGAETVAATATEETARRTGEGITGYMASDLATDTAWIDGLDEDFFSETMMSEDALRFMLECEKNSYASKVKNFEITYMEPRYELLEIVDGSSRVPPRGGVVPYGYDIIINGRHFRLEKIDSVERVREETFDLRELTFQYRLQWQIIYAIVKTIEQDETISKETVQKVVDEFKTEYFYEYDYYGNSKTSYTYIELAVLPHRGSPENYSPIVVLNKVETLFYDYTYEVKKNNPDEPGFSHEMGAVTATFNSGRFEAGMKNLGYGREDIEYFVELLDGMGSYNELVYELCNAYDITL